MYGQMFVLCFSLDYIGFIFKKPLMSRGDDSVDKVLSLQE